MRSTGKIITILAIGLAMLPIVSYAENASSTNQIRTKEELQEMREKAEDRKETIKEEMERRKEEVQNQIQERREELQNKVENKIADFILKISNRYGAAIERLEGIAERIESRIIKLEDQGINQTKAKELVLEAREKITTAKASLTLIGDWEAEMKSVASSTASSTASNIKSRFPELKNLIAGGKEDIKEAHAALVEVIKNIKPGLNKATTTETETEDEDEDETEN